MSYDLPCSTSEPTGSADFARMLDLRILESQNKCCFLCTFRPTSQSTGCGEAFRKVDLKMQTTKERWAPYEYAISFPLLTKPAGRGDTPRMVDLRLSSNNESVASYEHTFLPAIEPIGNVESDCSINGSQSGYFLS